MALLEVVVHMIQYDFGAGTTPTTLYWYDGGTGTATNSEYGGGDQLFNMSDNYTYTSFFAFGITGTWANSTDTFTKDGTTYGNCTVCWRIWFCSFLLGTSLYVILDEGSAEFADQMLSRMFLNLMVLREQLLL